MLTIVPYWQNLNSIEKIILSIKSKTCPYLSERNCFILKILKNSIDNTAVRDLSGFIRASNKEIT